VIEGKTALGVIAARGGSKGLPRKNVLPAGGKPLIEWSVAAGLGSVLLDRLIVSTDDPEIAAAAQSAGCDAPFLRPPELTTDEARIEDALLHALDSLDEPYDYIVLLQATSPLRRAEDIDGCLRRCIETAAPACVAVAEAAKSPYWMFELTGEDRLSPLLDGAGMRRHRQELPAAYLPTGAVYVAETGWFRQKRTFYDPETVGYVMPTDRSLDIDSRHDLLVFEAIIAEAQGGHS
jgi:CMP-N,N'-diacetyllegionaminic acid synthase